MLIKIFNDIFLLDMYLTEILEQSKEGLSRVINTYDIEFDWIETELV